MRLVVVTKKLRPKDLETARQEYEFYIKITADIRQDIVVIGGEYHADAEKLLAGKFNSQRSHIWGGGYNVRTKQFETNALINIRQPNNPSPDIVDPKAREKFLSLVKSQLHSLESLI